MSRYTLIAYDLTNEKDDSNRRIIRDKINGYCGQTCALSESCYLFETDDSIAKIFSDLEHVLDETADRLSVIKLEDIKSNLICGHATKIKMLIDDLKSA
jgi:hypothetical protein